MKHFCGRRTLRLRFLIKAFTVRKSNSLSADVLHTGNCAVAAAVWRALCQQTHLLECLGNPPGAAHSESWEGDGEKGEKGYLGVYTGPISIMP